jgi:hypothetical protein
MTGPPDHMKIPNQGANMSTAKQAAHLLLSLGSWWRASAYEIEGRRIRPAAGARLERYDPLQQDWKAPYIELGRLGEQIRDWYYGQSKASIERFRSEVPAPEESSWPELVAYIEAARAALRGAYGQPAPLPARIAADLCAFCETHGLLGIFQQETLGVSLPARPEAVLSLLGEQALLSRYLRYERDGSGWRSLSLLRRTPLEQGSHPELPRRSMSELVRGGAWPLDESRLLPGSVLTRRLPEKAGLPAFLDLGELEVVSEATFGQPSSSISAPDSREFWLTYGEDLVVFARYAVTLAEAMLGVQQHSARERRQHRERFNELLAPVSLTLVEERGSLGARVGSPSLIASLAAMAFFDLAGGMRIAHCERCGRLYASRRAERRFCSLACQELAKRARRYKADAAFRDRQQAAARSRMRARRAKEA